MANELKCDFMSKRSQMKGTIRSENYKSRWFKLTPSYLSYHDGGLTKIGKVKGQIPLSSVVAVEEVDVEALGKHFAFQVVYKESRLADAIALYIIAVHSHQMKGWIEALRQACTEAGAKFNRTYHPGIWLYREGKYSCCDVINKRSSGCNSATAPSEKSSPGKETEHEMTILPGRKRSEPIKEIPYVDKGVSETKRVLALYDYDAGDHEELSLVKGEEYDLLEEFKPGNWLEARNARGKTGVIPSSYVQLVGTDDDDLEQYEWYYKNISRLEGETMLETDGSEGCFMVRDSSQKGVYTLSIYVCPPGSSEGHTKHYHIKQSNDGQYFVADKHLFKTIPELIYYHKHNCAGLVVRLRSPPNDKRKPTPLIGTREIDPDELVIKETLGSGQFGTVSRGIYNGKTEVAVKIMKDGTMSEIDFIEEAKVMIKLQHNNLVKLYGVCTIKKPTLIVTEFMKHGALLGFLRRQKHRLHGRVEQLLDMSVQVCSAMEYLEVNSLIHRDLAARNCLVGENNVIKVADFGLARHVLDNEYTCSTGTKFPVRWSSPEILNLNKFSTQSDVWAFGVLMWEIFTCGDLPYGKNNQNREVYEKVCERRQCLEKPEKCPDQVYSIMISCWGYEPEDRPTFNQLCSDLRVIIENDYVE